MVEIILKTKKGKIVIESIGCMYSFWWAQVKQGQAQ